MVQETSFGNDRDQKTKRTATKLPREQGVMVVTGQETIRISRKGSKTKQFCPKENVYKRRPSLPHTVTSVPGSSVLFLLKRDKGLMRDRTQESSRHTFPDRQAGGASPALITLGEP